MSTNQPEPRLTAECRAFLREGLPEGAAWTEHVQRCAFCSARKAARRRFGRILGEPVVPPAALHSAAFLDVIRARIVEQCEQSPVGALLEQGMPVAPPAAVADAFPTGLLEAGLARETVNAMRPASEAAWRGVRNRVLGDLAEHRMRRVARAKGVAMVGVAAAAIFFAIFLSEGTQTPPTIVITDISSMPAVEFSPMAVLRHGSDH